MFLGKQGDFIVSYSESYEELDAVKDLAGFTEIIETDEPVIQVNGKIFVGIDAITEEQRQLREQAYVKEVDGITAHIQRLRDEDPNNPEIEELLTERSAKVEEIKERYPYPEVTNEEKEVTGSEE